MGHVLHPNFPVMDKVDQEYIEGLRTLMLDSVEGFRKERPTLTPIDALEKAIGIISRHVEGQFKTECPTLIRQRRCIEFAAAQAREVINPSKKLPRKKKGRR